MKEETFGISIDIDHVELIYDILKKALYSYEVYKRLVPYFANNESIFDPDERELWCNISDNCLQMAAIQWNKIFGTKDATRNNDNTHYTYLISAEEFDFCLMIKGIDFQDTIRQMRAFRDKYAAHKDKESFEVPYFYRPLKIIHEFDNMVKAKYDEIRIRDYLGLEGTHVAYKLRIENYLVRIGLITEEQIDDSEIL